MRRMRTVMGGITANAAGFVASVAPSAGVPLTLLTNTPPAPLAGQIHNQAVPVAITSASNVSGVNFTVIGLDRRGNPQTEIIAGPNATTVSGHFLFSFISSITPSASNAGTITIGWGSKNYGPWLISAFHQAAVNANPAPNSGAVTFDVYATAYDLLDPTLFLPQGAGGVPVSDMNQSGAGAGNQSGPYYQGTAGSPNPWPLVPAALQAAAPQLLSTVACLPEDDNTYSEGVAAPVVFTAAAAATPGTNTATEVRLDPTGAFAWRLVISSATGVAQMDINVIRPSLS